MEGRRLVGVVILLAGIMRVMSSVPDFGWFGDKRVLAETTSLSVEERLLAVEKRVAALERKTSTGTRTSGTKKEAFLSLSSGTAAGSEWTVVSGSEFWLNQELYGNVTGITWEGWLKIQDGNGVGFARLYDMTNNRAVDFSEVSVSSNQRASFYSPVLAIWRGQNQYQIEVKSSTGYPVTISESRLRIVFQ